jgi:hypothetical protein
MIEVLTPSSIVNQSKQQTQQELALASKSIFLKWNTQAKAMNLLLNKTK